MLRFSSVQRKFIACAVEVTPLWLLVDPGGQGSRVMSNAAGEPQGNLLLRALDGVASVDDVPKRATGGKSNEDGIQHERKNTRLCSGCIVLMYEGLKGTPTLTRSFDKRPRECTRCKNNFKPDMAKQADITTDSEPADSPISISPANVNRIVATDGARL